MFSGLIHPMSEPWFFSAELYHISRFVGHSSADGYLGYFYLLVTVNYVNIRVRLSVRIPAFQSFGNTHGSGIAGSYGTLHSFQHRRDNLIYIQNRKRRSNYADYSCDF